MTTNQKSILKGGGALKPKCVRRNHKRLLWLLTLRDQMLARRAVKAEHRRAAAAAEIERMVEAQQADDERRSKVEAEILQEKRRGRADKRQPRR